MKSPIVFASLIFCDVLEYCLFSLHQTAWGAKNKIVPMETRETTDWRSTDPSMRKRSTSIFHAVVDVNQIHKQGTALFIAATLLQRELIETTMPIQAAIILTILYASGAKSNDSVSSWTDDDYIKTMMYLGLDLFLEGIVFFFTVIILKQIYPRFSAIKIVAGLFRKHKVEFALLTFGSWSTVLLMQSTYSGMDMSLEFSWLDCYDHPNRTWVGGFDWDC